LLKKKLHEVVFNFDAFSVVLAENPSSQTRYREGKQTIP